MRSIRILLLVMLSVGVAAAAAPRERTLLVFGDSLSAAYGLRADEGWVAQLQKRLAQQGYGYRVVNASVSGETTAGGRARLARAIEAHQPQLVVLELGANDGLRGLPVKDARANLTAMIGSIKQAKADVLLAGIVLPPNYGTRYANDFAAMFPALSKDHGVPLVPFLLDGIALDTRYMQADGLHPNAAGQPLVLENVWKHLKPLLER
ncbi:MAG: arylesterase [Pseudomonadota bacterium]|nr:arylesterase [Pseudomonadota bacterium]